jgi:pyrimidine/purine-5'-nucleotide nucleosidase
VVTHASMRELQLHRRQPLHRLAANLRRAFSGIVTGNVKEVGVAAIERYGPYEIAADPEIMPLLDELLTAFVAQRRMKLPSSVYRPCYRLVS